MAGIKESKYIWMNGELIPWKEAKVHVLSHALHYASSVFEGIRCYKTPKGPHIFRLKDHIRRLFDSAKIYRMEIPYSMDEIIAACKKTIIENELEECYIRPLVFRGYHSLGVNPMDCPVEVAIAVWEWGKYLGPEALEKGVDVMISSWTRIAPNTVPPLAKASGNYANGQLIKMEAILYGFSEGIALDSMGFVSEGSGENIFAVRDGVIYTPFLDACILPGITRDTVIKLAKEAGYEVREVMLPREFLYIADEVFFTGTAAEITPIKSIDRMPIGKGERGPVTKRLQEMFFSYINGEVPDKYGWLEPLK